MKEKSLFTRIILLVLLALICIIATVGISLLAGAVDAELFDFKNLNLSNMIPVLLIGIFISCAVVGIAVLFVGKSAFLKAYDFYKKNNQNGGNEK